MFSRVGDIISISFKMVSDVWDQIRVMKVLASGDEELEKLSIVDEGLAF